jgi:hypothetical protein
MQIGNRDAGSSLAQADAVAHVGGTMHDLAIDLDNGVASLEARALSRGIPFDRRDDGTERLWKSGRSGDLWSHGLQNNANLAAMNSPCRSSCVVTTLTMLAGTAKPIPALPPASAMMAVLMPMSSPLDLTSGPPELPRLIGASVLDEVLALVLAEAAAPERADPYGPGSH